MKKKFLIFLWFFATFFTSFVFSQEVDHDFENQTVQQVYTNSPAHSNEGDVQSKPQTNYFDIKVDEKEGDRFLWEFVNMLMTLGLILGIIVLAAWLLKKMVSKKIQQLNTTSYIKIVETRVLSARTTLFLVDVNGSGMVLAESTNGVSSLGNFDIHEIERKDGFEIMKK